MARGGAWIGAGALLLGLGGSALAAPPEQAGRDYARCIVSVYVVAERGEGFEVGRFDRAVAACAPLKARYVRSLKAAFMPAPDETAAGVEKAVAAALGR